MTKKQISKKEQNRLISIVVPAYKQEKFIKDDLVNIIDTLEKGLPELYSFEIICVVDGELDNTAREARKIKDSRLKIISYPVNYGKGYAVRQGMKIANGDFISFLDAGMDISPKGVMMLLAHMEWYNADAVVGSKRHPVSKVNYPFLRKVLSTGYHWFVKLAFGLPITDTQSGIKLFKRSVIEKILPRLLVKRYAMDIEMLAVAKYLGFERIYEAPIEVTFDSRTSAIKWSTIFKMLWDSLAVFYRLRILHYYDDSNRKNWITS
ncbi:glycosyltransferase [Candidatus Woesebacteria bacterium]|jgi:glycosyltransferase involved in cell wall biosynthesis|nr:glycosyltransferase [Candidatus Woesebacteria bacterium]